MDFAAMKPADLRGLIRKGELTGPTTGMCNGYAQGNLVVLPKALAWDFLLFCQRNPKACPLLEVADAGERTFAQFGKGSDIATDIPRYRVYEHGELTGEYTDVSKFVPMYNTNIPCTPAGVFSGNMVVSMRPIPYRQVPAAAAITAGMPRVHGMPVQIGEPEAIGIHDLAHPDYGDAVTINPGETPVFCPCGVTPQNVVMHSKPEFCITHAPGHMFVTDVKNVELKY